MNELLELAEPLLAFAREALRAGRHRDARRAIEAARVYLGLYGPPQYVKYNPAEFIRTEAQRIIDDTHTLGLGPVSNCVGDPHQMFDCLRQLVRGAVLEDDSVLVIEVFEEDDAPCVALSFDGPGRFSREVLVEGFLPLPLEELGQRWTLATRGGRIDTAPNGILLRLTGVRMPPEPAAELEPLLEALAKAAGQLVSNCADPARGTGVLEQCLAMAGGEEQPKEPVGLKAVLGEVMDEFGPALAERGIVTEMMTDPSTPPILMQRQPMRAFFANVFRYTMAILPNTGVVALLTEYDASERALGLVIAIQGPNCLDQATFHLATMRRAVVELHEGAFEFAPDTGGVTLTATLTDPVGSALDAWIPGFEAFSRRSRRMLRLLKGGAQTPPEEFLLGGILEAELERWLLPKFAGPAAVNIAHDLPEENRDLPGSSPPRLEKALGQIKRGKPRKGIAAPAYAAEVLWAFRRDRRHRKAVGTEALGEDALKRLCLALLQTPPDYLVSLRIIAHALAPQ